MHWCTGSASSETFLRPFEITLNSSAAKATEGAKEASTGNDSEAPFRFPCCHRYYCDACLREWFDEPVSSSGISECAEAIRDSSTADPYAGAAI